MKPILRYRSQSLFIKSFKPGPVLHLRPIVRSKRAAQTLREKHKRPQVHTCGYGQRQQV